MQRSDRYDRSILRDGDFRSPAQQNKHRFTFRAFVNHPFAAPEVIQLRLLHQIVDVRVGETLKERFAA
jgi:hypothetical protein